jgi:hypothetical protein
LFERGEPNQVTGELRTSKQRGFGVSRARQRKLGILASLIALGASGACGPKASDGTTTAEERRTAPQPIAAMDCKGGSEQNVDVNNDGKPDITHHTSGDKRLCSVMDLNFDGRTDLLRFYADDGVALKVEQHDYDFDGHIDDQVFFKAGAVTHKELDTNFDGLIDTWMWCKGPLVEKAERARRRPGRVDTWEVYTGGQLSEIQYDENGDGRVEKWELFSDGALTEVRIDSTGDGKPDRTDPAGGGSDQRDKQVSCDGTSIPTRETPKFPAGDGTGDSGVSPSAPDAAAGNTAADAGVTSTSPAAVTDAGAPVDAFQPATDAGKTPGKAAVKSTGKGAK